MYGGTYEAFEGLWVRVSMAFERREQGSLEGGSIDSTAKNLDDGYCKRVLGPTHTVWRWHRDTDIGLLGCVWRFLSVMMLRRAEKRWGRAARSA